MSAIRRVVRTCSSSIAATELAILLATSVCEEGLLSRASRFGSSVSATNFARASVVDAANPYFALSAASKSSISVKLTVEPSEPFPRDTLRTPDLR
jgi:hypothetical protein